MSDFLKALTYPFRGIAYFAGRPALWKYAAAAVAIHLLAFVAVFVLYLQCRAGLVEGITPDRFPAWLRTVSKGILSVVMFVAALFAALLAGNLLSLPVLDALTERILKDLGESLPSGRGVRHALWRSFVNQTLKLLFFGTAQIVLLLLYVTPLAFLHPPVSTFLGILFLGLDYLDYPLDARRVPVPARFAWMFRHAGATLGYGSVLFLVVLVPLLGTLLMPLTVAGAALLAHRLDSPDSTG
jgi:CysZ protein